MAKYETIKNVINEAKAYLKKGNMYVLKKPVFVGTADKGFYILAVGHDRYGNPIMRVRENDKTRSFQIPYSVSITVDDVVRGLDGRQLNAILKESEELSESTNYEWVVVNSKGNVVGLKPDPTELYYTYSFASEKEAKAAISNLKDSSGFKAKKQKVQKQKVTKAKYSKKDVDALTAYYSRKSGSYTGD